MPGLWEEANPTLFAAWPGSRVFLEWDAGDFCGNQSLLLTLGYLRGESELGSWEEVGIQSQMCSQSLWCWDGAVAQGNIPRSSQNPKRDPGRSSPLLGQDLHITEAGLTEFRDQIPALIPALSPIPRFSWGCFGKPWPSRQLPAHGGAGHGSRWDLSGKLGAPSTMPNFLLGGSWRGRKTSALFQRLSFPASLLPSGQGGSIPRFFAGIALPSILTLDTPELLITSGTRAL